MDCLYDNEGIPKAAKVNHTLHWSIRSAAQMDAN